MQRRHFFQLAAATGGAALAGPALASCSTSAGAADGELVLWSHNAGSPLEIAVTEDIIAAFNAAQDEYSAKLEPFPQDVYNDTVASASISGDLPDLLTVDGPNIANWAWGGYLQVLDLPAEVTDRFLPSTLGRFQGEIYGIGHWEAACSIFARQSVLEAAGVRIPTMDAPWTREEFDDALQRLVADGAYKHAIDFSTADTGEWYPYAYSPFLQSFGGDLLDRETHLSADGKLNGPEALAWGEWFQGLFTGGLASVESPGGAEDFMQGKAAMAYHGNWGALAAMDLYDDMLFLPPPDFGTGPKIGGGSWQWAVSATAETAGAGEWLATATTDEYVAQYAEQTGLIPATDAAAELTEHYGSEGDLRMMVEYSKAYAVLRPETPAYTVIASVFNQYAGDIIHGGDVQQSLDAMVAEIDADIESNGGYGF
ncbi:extracellular solute-binding protein [Glycomyces harbinensis]|uniref:Multiple sugar transport system substrate-binding protein n=1 Tax=Glycomyces harbinensis TaxID=58114 RepID=A0A1G6XZ93_9ACTN|nr:extracellular solute-binding protein [Glycomyces harbinensis]SDD83544.1 multiple sugar transport system substrate-binding protein [Glycomyces harbinensis]